MFNGKKTLLFIPFLLFLYPHFLPMKLIPPEGVLEGKITKIYSNSLFVEHKKEKYYLMTGPTLSYEVGDIVSFEANFNLADSKDTFTIFVKSGGADYYSSTDLKLIKETKSIRAEYHRKLKSDNSKYSNYILALLYKTRTSKNEYILNIATEIGVSHLFIVSGFHISLFFVILDKISSKYIKNDKFKLFINSSVTFGFLWWIFMPYSGIRALGTTISKKTFNVTSNNALGITAFGFLLINPFLLFSTSLLLSFSISYVVNIVISWEFPNFETMIFISLAAFAVSTPIVSTWNDKFNILAPLFTILLTPLISILYIFLIFTMPFWSIMWFFDWILIILDMILLLFDRYKTLFVVKILSWSQVAILLIILLSLLNLNKIKKE